MPTTQQTTTSNLFNPAAMGAYQGMQPSIGNVLNWYMGGTGFNQGAAGSPFQSPLFQTGLGMGTKQALQSGQNMMGNILGGSAGWGGGATPGFVRQQATQGGYLTSGLRQSALWNALQNTVGTQLGATGTAAGFRPLQTGAVQQATTTGLGSWLPQVLGGVLGATTGTGGIGTAAWLKSLFGKGGGGGGGGGAADTSSFMLPSTWSPGGVGYGAGLGSLYGSLGYPGTLTGTGWGGLGIGSTLQSLPLGSPFNINY
jgi:hypothetical protein